MNSSKLADSRLEGATRFGADTVINNGREDAKAIVLELTDGLGADVSFEAVGMPAETVDGMDVLAVHTATSRRVAEARAGRGPSLIVADCYRFMGHFTADSQSYRTREEAEPWEARDDAIAIDDVTAGLLDLKWDIVCPSCRTASERVPRLADLPAEGHCQLCEVNFAMDLDRAVEATFSPHPSIRPVDEGPYCIGGPARTPHVYAQALSPSRKH